MEASWWQELACSHATSGLEQPTGAEKDAQLKRATAALADGDPDRALQLLDACLEQHPGCAEALWQRAKAHSSTGASHAAFFDLRRIEQIAPAWPGLAQELQQVAAACSRGTRPPPKARASMYARVRRTAGAAGGAGAAGAACSLGAGQQQPQYEVLGLQQGASLVDVRRAYKRLAAIWHPDASRWVGATVQERDAAAERFKALAAAHQALTSS